MIAYRLFWVVRDDRRKPVLRSIAMGTRWPTATMMADRRPEPENDRGIHALLPDADNPLFDAAGTLVIGAIDAYGVIRIHADDVIRSEFARILALRILPSACGHDVIREYDGVFVNACTCHWAEHQLAEMARRRMTRAELEEQLLGRYSVPRLASHPWAEEQA